MNMAAFPDGFDPSTAPDDFVPARPLEAVLAFFDIEPTQPSPVTLVEVDGSSRTRASVRVRCSMESGPLSANGYYQDVRAFGGVYEAAIYTPTGDYVDFGTMDLQGRQGLVCAGVAPDFAAGTCPPGMLLSETNDLGVRFTSERDTDEDGFIDAMDPARRPPGPARTAVPSSRPRPRRRPSTATETASPTTPTTVRGVPRRPRAAARTPIRRTRRSRC